MQKIVTHYILNDSKHVCILHLPSSLHRELRQGGVSFASGLQGGGLTSSKLVMELCCIYCNPLHLLLSLKRCSNISGSLMKLMQYMCKSRELHFSLLFYNLCILFVYMYTLQRLFEILFHRSFTKRVRSCAKSVEQSHNMPCQVSRTSN